MSKFYTNVAQIGNNVLVREVENGKRTKKKIEFQPTLYIRSKKPTKYTTVLGEFVEPVNPGTIQDTRDFLKQYADVKDFKIYGNTAYYYQWIAENYPEETVEYNILDLSLWSIDIETESEHSFARPETVTERINAITFRNINQNKTYVFGLERYGQKYTPSDPNVIYYAFEEEEDLLYAFFEFWQEHQPDIVTGWNISFFDIPYIINRGVKLFDEDTVRKFLSPWSRIQQSSVMFMEKERLTYEILGVSIIDYLRIYKKYTYEPRENFTLGYITQFEIGETKLSHDEFENFSDFYKSDFQRFIDYNIKDALLIEKLEAKLKMIELTLTVAYQAHVNYDDVLSQVRTWDIMIYNYLHRKNIVIPQKASFDKSEQYAGAYVKDPKPGMYKWVVSFDVRSLYPSIIMALNIGVETKVGRKYPMYSANDALDSKQIYTNGIQEAYNQNCTFSINGVLYSKAQISFFSELTEKLFKNRMEYRKQLKECEANGDKLGAAKFNLKQLATKIQLNSLYGAIGNQYFRFFDVENAEAVTLTGQYIIQFIERGINSYLNKLFNTNVEYVVYCDTDSVYITLDALVSKVFKDTSDTPKIIEFLDKACKDKLEPLIASLFSRIEMNLNAVRGHLMMAREVIANLAIWMAKKHYIVNVYDSEGKKFYDKPKLKAMGIEIKKAVVPKFCRDKMKEAVDLILNTGNNDALIEFVEKTKQEFFKLPSDLCGCPTGVNGVKKYSSETSLYTSGTQLHIKGAIVYNDMIDRLGLGNKYAKIQDGDRIKYVLLKLPNPTRDKVIGFLKRLPPELNLEKFIDYEGQWDKTFIKPLNHILEAIGWDYEKKSSLSSFF